MTFHLEKFNFGARRIYGNFHRFFSGPDVPVSDYIMPFPFTPRLFLGFSWNEGLVVLQKLKPGFLPGPSR
jgi:hypothetical protein